MSSLLGRFRVLEGGMQGGDIPREKTSIVLTSAGPEGYKTDLPGKTRLLGAIVAWRLWGWLITFWLDLRPTPQDSVHDWCWEPGQKSKAWEVVGSQGVYCCSFIKATFSGFILMPTSMPQLGCINSPSRGSEHFGRGRQKEHMGGVLRSYVLYLRQGHHTQTHYSLGSVQG